MKFDNCKRPRKFMVCYCDDASVRVGYAPVRCLLLSEHKEYKDTGEVFHTYTVDSELRYFSSQGLLVNNSPCLSIVGDLYDSYEECKQVCIEKNDEELSKIYSEIVEIEKDARKYNLNTEYMERREEALRKNIKKFVKIQSEIFETTDALYDEKSKLLDGGKAKQVVEKVKSNNKEDKENQGK